MNLKARGTRRRSWLKHCPTSRNVAGSIHGGVIRFLHSHNLSGRTMALESTQPLTELSRRVVLLIEVNAVLCEVQTECSVELFQYSEG
jgi:hypothetical protein